MESLEEFLQELRSVLEEATYSGDGLVPAYLSPLLIEAWPEVATKYEALEYAVQSGEYETRLQEAGLRGPQFRVKAEGFRRHLSIFRKDTPRKPKWLKKVLGWADIILGSLASVIPGGDAVQEFKEAIEAGAEDMDDGSAKQTEEVQP
jgi:hypothetical protein